VRAKDGTIAFPLRAQGGWTWKREFLAAQQLNPHLEALEAWIYETDCDCPGPFAEVPFYYRERVKLGKDNKGIVIKLGLNSGTYGKLAQSVGVNPPYQSWVMAGNVTSGCRAQLLEALSVARDPWNVLMFATDGIWSRERLALPKPVDTGTGDLAKPLGGWEEKSFPNGVFCVRPGIYFPIAPTEDQLKEVRARGLGKRILYDSWGWILDEWWSGNRTSLNLAGIARFVGAKSALHRNKTGVVRSPDYGEWIDHPIKVTYDPRPKRSAVMDNGRLQPWHGWDFESVPYKKALESPEAILLKIAELIAEEQPDVDFGDIN
jgi:hypothetical protein